MLEGITCKDTHAGGGTGQGHGHRSNLNAAATERERFFSEAESTVSFFRGIPISVSGQYTASRKRGWSEKSHQVLTGLHTACIVLTGSYTDHVLKE